MLTPGTSFKTKETVVRETPARAATSRLVTRLLLVTVWLPMPKLKNPSLLCEMAPKGPMELKKVEEECRKL